MPVLLLTALGTIEHRVKGLELGADDYLVKPFAFAGTARPGENPSEAGKHDDHGKPV